MRRQLALALLPLVGLALLWAAWQLYTTEERWQEDGNRIDRKLTGEADRLTRLIEVAEERGDAAEADQLLAARRRIDDQINQRIRKIDRSAGPRLRQAGPRAAAPVRLGR